LLQSCFFFLPDMNSVLLTSKARIPPIHQHLVRRARLIEALEHGSLHYKLILLSAPAGYGKTALLSQWAHTSQSRIAWLSISKEDNKFERCFRYLLAAWEQFQPIVLESPLGLLLRGKAPAREAVLSAFINTASEVSMPTVFILDDYHLIEDQVIHEALTFLIDHLPPMVHFVLASRGEPPLPIARYRAHGEMLELGGIDLRFLPEETSHYLTKSMGISLNIEEIGRLQTETEGWIAGIQLAALSLKQRSTWPGKPVVSGRQRFIADYLREDVLAHLPDDTQRFLLQSSFLDRLCSSLVVAVTGVENGQEMLEALERQALFLEPLDDHREWYRYHPLFADFLQEELKRRYPDDISKLQRRAARWYLNHDLPEQAFDHAIESQSAELIINIIERNFIAKLMSDDVLVVKGWLEALPVDWQSKYPIIGIAQAGILMVTGQFDACARRLDEVEQVVLNNSDHPDLYRGKVIAMRCNVACFQNDLQRAKAFAYQAQQFLAAEDLDFRAGIFGSLGDTYRRNGLWQEAKSSYLKLLDFTDASAFHIQAVHVYGALADLELRQGHLHKAAGFWNKALTALKPRENWGNVPLPLAGWVYIRMGEIHYEWNELEKAWECLSRGLERAELGGDARSLIAGYVSAGRLKLTVGELDVALDYLESARPYLENAQFPHWISRYERLQLELWLAQDKLRTAVQWSDEILQGEGLKGQPERDVTQLTVARVLIVKGDSPSREAAMVLIQPLIRKAEREGRSGILIEALALYALAKEMLGDVSGEMKTLEHALRLAEPEGYVRLFLDLGHPMIRLLQKARSRNVMSGYVEKLLSAFGDTLSSASPSRGTLPEPLTSREVEILKLLSAGLSNREIAGELVISPETVKKHAGNIYGKLGVGSRTEAAARARELQLLD
jgi:LuxR family maltose regulon positive regulatory protein